MKKRQRIITVVLIVIIGAVITAAAAKTYLAKNLEQLVELPVVNVDLGRIEDGVYPGSFSAFPIDVDVNVTVKNHRITDVDLVKHNNGQGAAAEVLTRKVVEAQALSVDSVSGATYSSKVILKAIEAALTSAIK